MEFHCPWDWVKLEQARGKWNQENRKGPDERFWWGSMGKASLGWFITLCSLRKLSPLNCPRMQWTAPCSVNSPSLGAFQYTVLAT